METIITPPDFTSMNMFGLHFRLIDEDDAPFILKLRTNPKLSRYLHSVDGTLTGQQEWIKKYKEREKAGQDYYFIFFDGATPIGLNRIYNIQDHVFTAGSWIFDEGVPFESAIASSLIVRIIAFEILGKDFENGFDGCHENNRHVLKFNKMVGMKESGRVLDEKGTYITMTLTKSDFLDKKDKIIKLLDLK
jgi:hypothetical protein